MVYLLEFGSKLYEFNGSMGRPAKALREICESFGRSMLLHRYELGFFYWHKHQCKDPERLILEKLQGDRLVLMHLDLYKDCPEKIKELLDYCEANGIDFFAPVSDGTQHYWDRNSFPSHQMEIRELMQEREHVVYDFVGAIDEKAFKSAMANMMRDLKLRELL